MQQDALARVDHLGDPGDRLDRAHLVVREHDRDEGRPVGQGRLEVVGVHAAVAVDRELDDLEAELLEIAQRVADGVVLHGRRDDAVPAGLAGPGRALESEVVGFGPAGGEHDLAGLGAEVRRDLLVRAIEGGTGGPPERVGAARVPEGLGHEREHRVQDLASKRGGGRVIQVDRHRADRTPTDQAGVSPRSAARFRSSAWPAARRRSCCDRARLRSRIESGRHLDEFVGRDELQRGLERDGTWRGQPERLVVRVGPDVRQLLLLGRIDVHVARARVLADDHALVDLDAGADEQLRTLLEVEQAVRVGCARAIARPGRRWSGGSPRRPTGRSPRRSGGGAPSRACRSAAARDSRSDRGPAGRTRGGRGRRHRWTSARGGPSGRPGRIWISPM